MRLREKFVEKMQPRGWRLVKLINGKWCLTLLLIALLVLGLAACERRERQPEHSQSETEAATDDAPPEPAEKATTETAAATEDEEETEPDIEGAEQAVRDFMAALQSGSREQIEAHIDYKNMLQLQEGQSDDNFREVLRRVRFEIVEASAGKSVANVETRIANIDLHKVMPGYFTRAGELEYNNALSESPLSPEELDAEIRRLFVAMLDENSENTIQNTVNIQLINTAGRWQVQSDEALRTAVAGDFWNASRNLGEAAQG